MAGYFLSEKDRATLKRIVDEVQRIFGNTRGRGADGKVDHEEHQAPEVYVALTPIGGIPALTSTGTGTGTGSYGGDLQTPGYAECDIYTIGSKDGEPELFPVQGLSRVVYNVSETAVEAGIWITIVRDKFGKWLAQVGGGGGTDGFWARITDKTYTTGQYTAYSWQRILDSTNPVPLTWYEYLPAQSGGPGDFPAYEVNNVDLPADGRLVNINETGTGTGTGTGLTDDQPFVVWMRLGAGAYYLFEQTPRWEIVENTGETYSEGGTTYNVGYLLRWDQDSKTWVRVESIFIVDANAGA